MPVAGEPLIRRIATWLAAGGVTDIVVNLHHRPETLTAVLGDGNDLGVRVRYSWEQPRVLGSAGGPRLALPLLGVDTFLLVNGDTLTNVDIAALVDVHRTHEETLVTLALVPNTEFDRYSGVKTDGEGRVTGFARRGDASRGTGHFIGVQVVNASVFEPLTAGEPASTIGGLYDRLIAERPGSVRAHFSNAAFWDVGTASDYLRTSHAFGSGQPAVGRNARIDRTADIDGSVLWDDVQVGAGASIRQCILADGVEVPAGARYQRSILMRADDSLVVTPIDN
jgi:NDP-sugar pyrophosphorylase family protein